MKTLATVVLAVISVIASLCFVISGLCAYTGGINGLSGRQPLYFAWAVFYLAIVIAAMTAIKRLNRKPPDR